MANLDQLNATLQLLEELTDMENKIDKIYLPIETMYSKLRSVLQHQLFDLFTLILHFEQQIIYLLQSVNFEIILFCAKNINKVQNIV